MGDDDDHIEGAPGHATGPAPWPADEIQLTDLTTSLAEGQLVLSGTVANRSGVTVPAGTFFVKIQVSPELITTEPDPNGNTHTMQAFGEATVVQPITESLPAQGSVSWSHAVDLQWGLYNAGVQVVTSDDTTMAWETISNIAQTQGPRDYERWDDARPGHEVFADVRPEIFWIEHVGLSADRHHHAYRVHFRLRNEGTTDLGAPYTAVVSAAPSAHPNTGYWHPEADYVRVEHAFKEPVPAGVTSAELALAVNLRPGLLWDVSVFVEFGDDLKHTLALLLEPDGSVG